ncbi:Calmodulin-binding protein [Fagus crenata]
MVRKKDRFWEYDEESNGRFKYKFCERDFAGGAPRIKSHLARVKGLDIDLCTEVPKDVQAEAYLAIGGPSKKLKSASNLSNAEEIKTPTSMSNDLPQTTMLEMCKKKDQSVVDKLLTQHVILNNISFDAIQTLPFIRFVQGVAAYGSGYKVPSYSTLRTKLIPNSR